MVPTTYPVTGSLKQAIALEQMCLFPWCCSWAINTACFLDGSKVTPLPKAHYYLLAHNFFLKRTAVCTTLNDTLNCCFIYNLATSVSGN